MKALIFAVAVACALTAPVATYAQQTNAPQTRAEVRAQLVSSSRSASLHAHDIGTRSIYFGH